MNWDDPDNFKFPLDILCLQRNRIKTIFENTWLQNITYGYQWDQTHWQQIWPGRYAPNSTLVNWEAARRGGRSTPPYYPGPNFIIAGTVNNYINRPEYADWLPLSFLEELGAKKGWQEIPTWEQVEEVVTAQTLQSTETPYTPYGGRRYYRQEFIDFVLARSEKIYEFDYPFDHLGYCYLGSGRVAPSAEDNRPELEYKNWVYFVTNTETTKVTLYMVKCGCLCCPPCGCNKPATAPGEG